MNNDLRTEESAADRTRCRTNRYIRILVADDDRDIRLLSAEVLFRSGYQTETVADGAATWEALQDNPFSLLITDNNMPTVSGVELVRKLSSSRMTLPVILASGAMPTKELKRFQLAATLAKPFAVDELLDTVKKVLSQPSVIAAMS